MNPVAIYTSATGSFYSIFRQQMAAKEPRCRAVFAADCVKEVNCPDEVLRIYLRHCGAVACSPAFFTHDATPMCNFYDVTRIHAQKHHPKKTMKSRYSRVKYGGDACLHVATPESQMEKEVALETLTGKLKTPLSLFCVNYSNIVYSNTDFKYPLNLPQLVIM